MCIVCNVIGDGYGHDAFVYLSAFEASQKAMRKAATSMLTCSKNAVRPEDRKRYDAEHKKMVRLIREWNKLEHFREIAPQG